MDKLDEEDFIIISELQKEGRISYAELSRRTGIPGSTLHDRVGRLVSKGVIKKFVAILDGVKVGVDAAAIIGLETGAQLYSSVAKALCEMEEVVEVYGTTAEHDLMIKVRTPREELSNILNRIRRIDGVDDIYVCSIIEVFKEEHTLPLKESVKQK